ncbi:MAG: hypothetical protein J6C90_01155 [Clostridia bacterium]|nr:hypothetical protein [Clostridia bacterium]
MRIIFVADVANSQEKYDLLNKVFDNSDIITFIRDKDKDSIDIDCPAVVYFSGAVHKAVAPYLAEVNTLYCFASANFDEAMLLQISQKTLDNDIVYVRKRPSNFFTRLCASFYNLFVRAFVSAKDTCASSKIIYLSAHAMTRQIDNGGRFRFMQQLDMRSDVVYYTKGVKPKRVKAPFQKPCWITLIVMVGILGLAVVLDLFLKLPFIVQIAFDLLFVLALFAEIAFLFKNLLDNRIEGKK